MQLFRIKYVLNLDLNCNWIWIANDMDQKTIQCPLSNVNVMHLGVHLVTWGSLLLKKVTKSHKWISNSYLTSLRLKLISQLTIIMQPTTSYSDLWCLIYSWIEMLQHWPHVLQSSKRIFNNHSLKIHCTIIFKKKIILCWFLILLQICVDRICKVYNQIRSAPHTTNLHN